MWDGGSFKKQWCFLKGAKPKLELTRLSGQRLESRVNFMNASGRGKGQVTERKSEIKYKGTGSLG